MNFHEAPKPEQAPENSLLAFAREFLSDAKDYLSDEEIAAIVRDRQPEYASKGSSESARAVSYDKYKKSFSVGNETVSMGTIVAARRMGVEVALPEELNSSGDGKKLRRILGEKMTEDAVAADLNKQLAAILANKTKDRDMMKSAAYEKIAERAGTQSEQLGIKAEEIVMGVLEGIAIDRPDLGLNILPANAYQDVEEKIDFIIATKQKRKKIGVEGADLAENEKHIGIQFTINASAAAHKQDQIQKAKARGVDVDDILYVQIDSGILARALSEWKKTKSIKGPWNYLPKPVRERAIQELFKSILTEEQVRGLVEKC